MYVFAFFSMPLAYFCLSAWYKPGPFDTRLFFRGLLAGLPAVLIWLFLRPIYNPLWGSWLLLFSFFFKYWFLPFGLSVAGFAVFVGFSGKNDEVKLPLGYKSVLPRINNDLYEKALPFGFGILSVFSVSEAVLSFNVSDPLLYLLLPLCLLAAALSLPLLIEEIKNKSWLVLAAAIAALLLLSFGNALLYLRREVWGILISVLFIAASGFYGMLRFLKYWDQRGSNPPPTA